MFVSPNISLDLDIHSSAVIYCRLYEDKTTKLRSPNFRVSRTRLIVYNVPKTMSEKDLKQIFMDAVTSRATKQKPSILQVEYGL